MKRKRLYSFSTGTIFAQVVPSQLADSESAEPMDLRACEGTKLGIAYEELDSVADT